MFTPTRNRGAISTKGGAVIKIKEVGEDGAELGTVAGSVYDLGYIKETTFMDKTAISTIYDEAGDAANDDIGNREVVVTGEIMQSDKALLDIVKETRGKYYAMLKYNGQKDGKNQEMFIGVGKFDPNVEIKWMGGTFQFKFTAMKLTSAITIAASVVSAAVTAGTGGWGSFTSGTVTIAANDYYTIVETSV